MINHVFDVIQIHCMDISPSGGLGICSAGDGKMWIWDTDNGETRVNVLPTYKDMIMNYLCILLMCAYILM